MGNTLSVPLPLAKMHILLGEGGGKHTAPPFDLVSAYIYKAFKKWEGFRGILYNMQRCDNRIIEEYKCCAHKGITCSPYLCIYAQIYWNIL